MSNTTPTDFGEDLSKDRLLQMLSDLYLEYGMPLDQMAYTETFDELHAKVVAIEAFATLTKADVYRRLLGMRKAGILPRIRTDRDSISSQKGMTDAG